MVSGSLKHGHDGNAETSMISDNSAGRLVNGMEGLGWQIEEQQRMAIVPS